MVAQILPRLIDIFTFEFNKKKLQKRKITEKKRRAVLKKEKLQSIPSFESLEDNSNEEGSDICSDDEEDDDYMAGVKYVKKEVNVIEDI